MSNIRNDYYNLFNSTLGKDVLADLKKFCHHESPTYVVGDPMHTAYNEGMRRVLLRILSFSSKSQPITEE